VIDALVLQTTISPLEAVLLAFVLGCGIIAAVLRDILGVIIAAAAYSLGVAVIWVVLRAPDVALTEAAVGAGVTTLLFLLTLAKTANPSVDRRLELPSLGSGVALLAFVVVLGLTVPAMPAIGGSPITSGDVSQYYLENAYEQTEVENVVTAVLAAYRGFDTLGEAVVVFSAGVAVLVVLQREVFA
jgi:multicomponent Na+:H+ antiporter subunit B